MEEFMSNYKIIGKIHESDQGDLVRLVRYDGEDKKYIIKFIGPLDNELKKIIFDREVNALKVLNKYDDIVKIHHHETGAKLEGKKNMGSILLEYAGDKTLEDINFYEWDELKKYKLCVKILRAIKNAHNNGIIHRDIKPSNIMYFREGIKIIDFGSSKIKSLVENKTITHRFSIGYSSPELIKGKETTELSDIYSVGCLFYKIFTGDEPKDNFNFRWKLEEIAINSEIIDLIMDMTEENPEERPSDIDDIIKLLEKIIGNLNTEKYSFNFSIDSMKLESLKSNYIVPGSMTYQHFLSTYLINEFKNIYGEYDDKKDLYKYIGNNLYMECKYKEDISLFVVTNLYRLEADRIQRMKKRFFKVVGKICFSRFNQSSYVKGKNNNLELTNMIKNHKNEIYSNDNKNKMFNDLFDLWKDNLNDSITNERANNPKINFENYKIENNKLTLKVKEYKKRDSYEELNNETRYLVEYLQGNKLKFEYIGNYEDISFDNGVHIIIDIKNKKKLQKIKTLLSKTDTIEEDFNYKIGAYKRQLSAISALYNEEYSSRNLKDIILDIQEPQSIQNLKPRKFFSDKLNQSQKNAVNKVLNSECITLIQGPPGTGKTTVINEIIDQIILSNNGKIANPKILIVSQSHTAVDNILEGIKPLKGNINTKILRIGDAKNITKEVYEKYTIDSMRKSIYDNIKEKSNNYIDSKEDEYKKDPIKNEIEEIKWENTKVIQKEWVKRCSDYESLDYQLVNSASIIAGTCIGFLGNDFVREIEFDYVIVDEAAKATSPELLVSIIKAKKIVLVGDQNQLSPFINKELSVSAKKLDDPKFRLFDILFNILPDTHKEILTKQYRMIRNIGDLISTVFYDGIVQTGIDDKYRMHNIDKFSNKSIIWFNTSNLKGKHEEKQNKTYFNLKESELIKDILLMLDKSNKSKQDSIGIITAYRAQREMISKKISNIKFNNLSGFIDINTLDAFQGRENDIIIYSTVRTKDSIGFQQEKERINVAFSRAKKLLIICGDLEFFYNWDRKENRYIDVIDYIRENNEHCEIINLKDGDTIE